MWLFVPLLLNFVGIKPLSRVDTIPARAVFSPTAKYTIYLFPGDSAVILGIHGDTVNYLDLKEVFPFAISDQGYLLSLRKDKKLDVYSHELFLESQHNKVIATFRYKNLLASGFSQDSHSFIVVTRDSVYWFNLKGHVIGKFPFATFNRAFDGYFVQFENQKIRVYKNGRKLCENPFWAKFIRDLKIEKDGSVWIMTLHEIIKLDSLCKTQNRYSFQISLEAFDVVDDSMIVVGGKERDWAKVIFFDLKNRSKTFEDSFEPYYLGDKVHIRNIICTNDTVRVFLKNKVKYYGIFRF